KPISKEKFLQHFWWCYGKAQKCFEEEGRSPPGYFKFLTLLAFRIFLAEKVDVLILEVGLGGRLDPTNVIGRPAVCGISSLGYDHTQFLGNTLTEIAREKAGIFKKGVPCYTVPQDPEAMASLAACADWMGEEFKLKLIQPLDSFRTLDNAQARVGLAGDHQRENAALAVALCRTWALRTSPSSDRVTVREAQLDEGVLPAEYAAALVETTWPGRGQELQAGPGLRFFLDGAHTVESLAACARWYGSAGAGTVLEAPPSAAGEPTAAPTTRVLVFNCTEDRDPEALLSCLARHLRELRIHFHHAIFVSGVAAIGLLADKMGLWVGEIDLWTGKMARQACKMARQSCKTALQPVPPQDPQNTAWQQRLQSIWDGGQTHQADALSTQLSSPVFGEGRSRVAPSSENAVQMLRLFVTSAAANGPGVVEVLVTGSLQLVGGMLEALEYEM
ncbi:hypothetical protein CYMTET_4701, partial [Cymbomonas tetramitiformis]